jgi:RNA polymerase sigma-70 factor (ECF subfamily)
MTECAHVLVEVVALPTSGRLSVQKSKAAPGGSRDAKRRSEPLANSDADAHIESASGRRYRLVEGGSGRSVDGAGARWRDGGLRDPVPQVRRLVGEPRLPIRAFTGAREEIAQTAFLQLYRARHRYEPRAGFLAYLYRITTNVCLNEMRCREYSKTIESLNAPLENGSGGWDAAPSRIADAHSLGPIEHLVGVSLAAKVQKVLDRLPLNQRAAFLLGRVGGLSYRDVAESLQTSVSAVKSLIFRATSTLRNELQDVL